MKRTPTASDSKQRGQSIKVGYPGRLTQWQRIDTERSEKHRTDKQRGLIITVIMPGRLTLTQIMEEYCSEGKGKASQRRAPTSNAACV